MGQARTGLCAQVQGHDLEPDRPGAAGSGPGLRPDPGRLRVPPGPHAHCDRRFRLLRDASRRPSSAPVVGPPLPQRQPRACADRVRAPRRSARGGGDRLGGAGRVRRAGRAGLVRLRHVGTRLPMRGQRGASLRLGCRQGAARLRRDPGGPAVTRRGEGHRGRGGPPPGRGSRHGGVPGRLGRDDLPSLVPPSASRRATSRTCSRSPRWRRSLAWARDPRLAGVLRLVLGKADREGRWRNEQPYRGRLWSDVDAPGAPSPWVTLRACRVLRAALG